MPLSEEEQRVLAEIERQFRETEPDLAHRLGSSPPHAVGLRPWRSVGALVVGFVIVLLTFARWPVAAFAGFVMMVMGGVWLAQALRHVARARLVSLGERARSRPVTPPFPLRRRPPQQKRGEPPFTDEI